jgi:hypothetical protein
VGALLPLECLQDRVASDSDAPITFEPGAE